MRVFRLEGGDGDNGFNTEERGRTETRRGCRAARLLARRLKAGVEVGSTDRDHEHSPCSGVLVIPILRPDPTALRAVQAVSALRPLPNSSLGHTDVNVLRDSLCASPLTWFLRVEPVSSVTSVDRREASHSRPQHDLIVTAISRQAARVESLPAEHAPLERRRIVIDLHASPGVEELGVRDELQYHSRRSRCAPA